MKKWYPIFGVIAIAVVATLFFVCQLSALNSSNAASQQNPSDYMREMVNLLEGSWYKSASDNRPFILSGDNLCCYPDGNIYYVEGDNFTPILFTNNKDQIRFAYGSYGNEWTVLRTRR